MMRVLEGRTRAAFLAFFLSHIPITILIDGQGAFGRYYPQLLVDLVLWYCHLFGDVLMMKTPLSSPQPSLSATAVTAAATHWEDDRVWFSSLICCEILFQLPFFVVAVHVLRSFPPLGSYNEIEKEENHKAVPVLVNNNYYPEWFRVACIVYGSHVSTTMIPILATFVASQKMSVPQKCATTASK